MTLADASSTSASPPRPKVLGGWASYLEFSRHTSCSPSSLTQKPRTLSLRCHLAQALLQGLG